MQNLVKNSFKVAVCQTRVSHQKSETLSFIKTAIDEAAQNGARMSILGETFNCFYSQKFCREAAENLGNPEQQQTVTLLRELAKQHNMYIFGSIPEVDDQDKLYNTCLAIGADGSLIKTYRKMHLFDIDIPGKITYKESDTFGSGNEVVVVDTEFCKIGLAICYDVRFHELAGLMQRKGAKMLIYPGSFNLTTGPLHWELLLRSRALDTQTYVVGSCVARFKEDTSIYQAWGHSTIVDPFGKVCQTLEENPGIIYHDIDLDYVEQVRNQIPILKQKRNDVYDLIQK